MRTSISYSTTWRTSEASGAKDCSDDRGRGRYDAASAWSSSVSRGVLRPDSESFESGGHSLLPQRIQTQAPSLRSQDLWNGITIPFRLDSPSILAARAAFFECQRINGNSGRRGPRKPSPGIGLRRVLGAPDAMFQFDHTDSCQGDSFLSEDGFDIGQKTYGGPALAFSCDDRAGVED